MQEQQNSTKLPTAEAFLQPTSCKECVEVQLKSENRAMADGF
jgi:hypothetical protein